MRSGSVEGVHIRVEHAVELLLMQDEQMIEALTPYTAEEPLTDGIRARGVIRSFKNLNVTRLSNPSEAHTPNLPSLSRMRYLGPHQRRWLPEAVVQSKRRWDIVSCRRGSLCAS